MIRKVENKRDMDALTAGCRSEKQVGSSRLVKLVTGRIHCGD